MLTSLHRHAWFAFINRRIGAFQPRSNATDLQAGLPSLRKLKVIFAYSPAILTMWQTNWI
jgi:hypothetical protein